MLPDIGWSEMLVIGIVLIIVVGPKDLPKMLRNFGKTMSSMRKMAGDFQRQFNDALREAELDDVKKTVDTVRSMNPASDIRKALNPLGKVGEDIRSELKKSIETGPAKPSATQGDGDAAEPAQPAAAPAQPAGNPTLRPAPPVAARPEQTPSAEAQPAAAGALTPPAGATAPPAGVTPPAAARKAVTRKPVKVVAAPANGTAAAPAAENPAARRKTAQPGAETGKREAKSATKSAAVASGSAKTTARPRATAAKSKDGAA